MYRKSSLVIALCLLLLMLAGCAELGTRNLIKNPKIRVQTKNLVFFFIDGVNNQVFTEMQQSGSLPNIDKYLIKRGCWVKNAVTVVPSITYAVTATFATGQVPGHHGILGNRFFDRDRLLYMNYNTIDTYRDIDLDYTTANFYEMLDNRFSTSIQTPLSRGSYYHIANWATSGTCWWLGLYETVDRWTARRFRMIADIADKSGQWPSIIYAYFPATDQIGHLYGPDSARYRQSLENVDRQIGHICSSLEKSKLLDKTYLIFISDHGMALSEKDNYVNIEKILRETFHLKVAVSGPNQHQRFPKRARFFNKYDAVVSNGSGRRAVIYLKNGDNWQKTPTLEQISPLAETFAAQEGVCLVAYRGKNGIIIQSRRGRAMIQRKPPTAINVPTGAGNMPASAGVTDKRPNLYEIPVSGAGIPLDLKQYRYQVIDGKDPAGYDTMFCVRPLLDGRYHNGSEWLKASCRSEYPDLPVQIVELFDSRRAGDLVVFAADNWDFDRKIIGGHGSVRSDDMHMPLILAGPQIRAGMELETARTVDIAPTIIDMLEPEKAAYYRFDGHSLLPQIRN